MALTAAALAVAPTTAAEQAEGSFVAMKSCEAFQSKNKGTNPGGIRTEPLRAYEVHAVNRSGGGYFLIKIPEAPVTTERWVSAACGVRVVEPDGQANDSPSGRRNPPASDESTENLLVLSWQPAFCETMARTAECRALNDGGLPAAATRLSIHGLWAQPEALAYCDVPAALIELDHEGRWSKLPPVALDARTRARLRVAMPGAASGLDRHEWLKHGTCHRGTGGAEGYFDDTLSLADAINASPVGSFLADEVGATVRASDIRAAFDAAFGAGTGARVEVRCADDGRRTLIHELMISLRGEITPQASLRALMLAADPVAPGCREGVIDPAGLQ